MESAGRRGKAREQSDGFGRSLHYIGCLGCLYEVESRNAEGCLGLKAISDWLLLFVSL